MKLIILTLLILQIIGSFAINQKAVNGFPGDDTPCTDHTDQSECEGSTQNGDGCVWCVSKAVPSICCTPAQAKTLPPGVFECQA